MGYVGITRTLIQKIPIFCMLKLLSIQQNKIQTEDHYIINNKLDDLLNKELDELFLNANNCIDDENFLEAIEFYDLILKIEPKNISALIDKGVTLQILGRIKLSLRSFNKALELSPKNIDALINKGSALHLSEQYLDAIACYDEALEIDQKCPMALAYKGLSLGELGNLTESISCFKKALSIDEHCTLAQISKDTAQELLKSVNLNSKKL